MAPPRLHEPPNQQLSGLLIEAREMGMSFDEAWERAVRPRKAVVMTTTTDPPAGAIRWPTDRNDRQAWQVAIRQTREAWREEYEGRPRRRCVAAVVVLLEVLRADDGIAAGTAVRSAA